MILFVLLLIVGLFQAHHLDHRPLSGKVQVGQTIQNEIVYLLTMKKEYCYLMKPNCHPIPNFDYFCWPLMFKVNIMTVNQSGVVIDNDILRDDFVSYGHLEALNYDDLSCFSC